jgi:anti-sigma factor RsiW
MMEASMRSAGCERVQSRLEAVVDTSLPALDQARDEGHLEGCAACCAAAERHRAWLRDLRAHLAPSAPELAFARQGLGERVAGAHGPRSIVARRLLRVGGAAAAGLLALAAVRELGWFDGGARAALAAVARLDDVPAPHFAWPRIPTTSGGDER